MAELTASNRYDDALKNQRSGLAVVFIFSGFVNILLLTGSVYMLQVYDRVLTSGSIVTLLGLFAIVIVLYFFFGLFDFLRQRTLSRIAIRLDLDLGPPLFRAWVSGGHSTVVGGHAPLAHLATLRQYLSNPVALSLFDLPFVPIFLGALFLVHFWLGVMVLIGAGIAILIAISTRALTRKKQDNAVLQNAVIQEFSHHSLQTHEAIAAMRMQDNVTRHWETLQQTGLALHQKVSNPSEIATSASKTVRLLLQSSILTVGAVLVLQDQISAGMIIASSVLSSRALAPIDQVIGQWHAIGKIASAHRTLRGFFADTAPAPNHIQLPAPKGRISVKSLTKYAPLREGKIGAPLVNAISFELEPGDGLGVIGKSAAGKTLLARLLVGAWQPDRGSVQLDGTPLEAWRPSDLARVIGYLPQRVDLLPGTIRQNIARFHPDATDGDVLAAAQLAGVHDLITALPDGYASRVGGQAATPLSGGQIQRIGLARAVMFRPRFLVLDEPNAHLDGAGDDALDAAILDLRAAGSTVIVMAHRPSAISTMNKIMILDQGRLIRIDTKEAVLGPVHPSSGAAVRSHAAISRITPKAGTGAAHKLGPKII